MQSMKKGTKKATMVDEWRSGSVEDRLEYSLVKVREKQLQIIMYLKNSVSMLVNSFEHCLALRYCQLLHASAVLLGTPHCLGKWLVHFLM